MLFVQLHAPVSVDMRTGSTALAPSLAPTHTNIHTHPIILTSCIPHSFGQAVIIVLRIAFIHQVGTEVVQCIDQNTGAAAVHSAMAHALVTPTHSFFAVGLAGHAWQLLMAVLAGGSVSSSLETCQTAAVQKLVRDVNITSMYYETGIFRHTFALSGLHLLRTFARTAYIAPY